VLMDNKVLMDNLLNQTQLMKLNPTNFSNSIIYSVIKMEK